MRSMKKLASLVLCSAMVLSFGFTSLADVSVPRIPENVEVIPLKDDAPSIRPSGVVAQPRNDQGEPRDTMRFYYIKSYPLVMLDDGTVAYMNYNISLNSPNQTTGGSGQYLTGSISKAETQNIHNYILSQKLTFIGWRNEVKLRFDYITPYTWTHTPYGRDPITSAVPSPHNPYQTYIYTFNSYLPTDLNYHYYAGMSGTVSYKNNNINQTWEDSFQCYMKFNSPN